MDELFTPTPDDNLFAEVNQPQLTAPTGNSVTARLVAFNEESSPLTALTEQGLKMAQQRIANGEEESIRLKTAADRQARQAKALASIRNSNADTQVLSSEQRQSIDDIYNGVVTANIADAAKTSIERNAVDRINDAMAEGGDPVEAKLINDLYFGRGTAMKVYHDEMTKNLLISQKIEQYEAENSEAGWIHKGFNFLTGLIPLNSNFARTGVVPGVASNVKSWLLSGTAAAAQGDALWRNYTPEQLANALQDGGELDTALRGGGTTFGVSDTATSADILRTFQAQSASDKMWANVWSVADPLMLVPFTKVASVPKMLVRAGARKAATDVAADAVDNAIRLGSTEGKALTGVGEREAVEHLETTAMNPSASTPNAVPLAVDVAARAERNQAFVEELGGAIQQVQRATNPEEVQAAIVAKAAEIEKRYGSRVKDISYEIEDIPTGTRTAYEPGAPLPAQGNSVVRATVTLGRKGGGGYATARSALSAGLSRLGLVGRVIGGEVENDVAQTAAEAGFTQRAFHGTSAAFDNFEARFAGSATGAENARGGVVFLTDDPAVGHSYARKAAQVANQREFEEAQAAFKADPSDANGDRFEAAIERVSDDAGQNIRPMDLDTSNFYVADMKGAGYNGPVTQSIIDKAKAEGKDGVVFRNYDDDILNGKVSTTYAVFNYGKMRSAFEGPVLKKDVSGQYFAQAEMHVPLEGFATTPLNTPDNGIFRFGRSYARRVDRDTQIKAVAAGASTTQLQAAVAKRMKEALKGISAKEHGTLDAIVRAGQNKDVWLSEREFNIAWERMTGEEVASPKIHNAYRTYQDVNDTDFFMRRAELYRRDVNAGRENVKLKLGKTRLTYDNAAKISDQTATPTGRIFNATDHVNYNKAHPLSESDWAQMRNEGYVLIEAKESILMPDGLRVNQVIARQSDIERSALSIEKGLGYKAGGHRAYTGRYFVKQAQSGVQPDNGSEYLTNPSVWRTGNNRNRLAEWTRIWNNALADARKGVADPTHFDDNVFANMKGLSFPSGEDFVEGVRSGRIDIKHDAELVADREMPSIYNSGRDDVDRFIDEAEGSDGGYYRTTGRMYTSARGNALLDESGEFAETVDPWEMTDRAISQISRVSSFQNYKDNLLERFKATYGNDLKLRQLENATPAELMKAEVRDHVAQDVARRIKAEQVAFANIMNHETAYEKAVRHRTRAVAEWVLGDAEGGIREKGHDFVYWLSKNNPVNFLRGLAFDSKLGLFNVGQFFLQSSTMLTATALSPAHGLKGMMNSPALYAFTMSKGSESVLDTLAKNGAWKAASFADEREFKDFSRFMYKSGFLDVNSTHLNINDLRPTRYFGAASKVDNVRQMGRVFFYGAEVFNRAVAGRIAWEELKSQGVRLGSAEFRERFIGLADDYSMNMTSESSASFQRGLWSIPTQFWGYNVRMMDAMFGKRFTTAQRTRLILSQFLLYGAGGVPVLDAVDEMVRNRSGAGADAGTLQGLISRGVLDNAIAAVSGADVRVGERIGSGTFLTDTAKKTGVADVLNSVSKGVGIGELLHVAEFDRVSLAELAGGATASISGAGFKTVGDLMKFGYHEGGVGDVTKENLIKLFDNVSTFSNAHKAYLAQRYGIYKSQKGTVLDADVPAEDAVWFALGLGRPQSADNAEFQIAWSDQRKARISEAAKQIRNWRQEAMTRPDVVDENSRKQWTLLELYTPDEQKEILQQTRNISDRSFYEHIQNKYDQEANQQEEVNGEPISNAQ